MLSLLWLLLPVAAASGWFLAKRDSRRQDAARSGLAPDYFQGLNYLLNEQPDKAIEVFVRMLEVDSNTVEIHLALGNLFRRRGEVDRAIRIHQNLIARPTLSRPQRMQALLELGQDYMRAGLLDRAEHLFQELIDADFYTDIALRLLVDIYQREKEWEKAVDAARRWSATTGRSLDNVIAHYYCELAEEARQADDKTAAVKLSKRALSWDWACARASILQGDMALNEGGYKGALRAYRRVYKQDPAYLPEVIGPLETCYRALGRVEALQALLEKWLASHHWVTLMVTLARLLEEREGTEAAIRFLGPQLHQRPSLRGLAGLIDMETRQPHNASIETLRLIQATVQQLLADKPVYRCAHCGFTGRSLYWQCPGCRNWGTVKPIQGLEGE